MNFLLQSAPYKGLEIQHKTFNFIDQKIHGERIILV